MVDGFLTDGLRAGALLLAPFFAETRFLLLGRFLLVLCLRPTGFFFEEPFFLLVFARAGFFLLVARFAVFFLDVAVFFLLGFFFNGFFRAALLLAFFFATDFLRGPLVTDFLAPLVFFFLAAAFLFSIGLASKLDLENGRLYIRHGSAEEFSVDRWSSGRVQAPVSVQPG